MFKYLGALKFIKRQSSYKTEIERITSSQDVFNAYVYTSVDDAIKQLEQRKSDKKLLKYVDLAVKNSLPKILENGKKIVIFRNVMTPNYEIRRFVNIIDALNGQFEPVFFEYLEDKFTDKNDWKYNLGKISFNIGKDKKGNRISHKVQTMDFTKANGKKISEARTLWGQSIVDFHHEMFFNAFKHLDKKVVIDGSEWLSMNSGGAKEYYKSFLKLFLTKGILFENFMLDAKEINFTKEVFLPSFIKIYKETGKKPLIVALEPTDIEGDNFWLHHPGESLDYVKKKFSI